MRRFLPLLFFIAASAYALPNELPQGFSYWFYSKVSNVADVNEGGRRTETISIWLIRKGDLICGRVEQDYGLAFGNKSPSGRIAGKKTGNEIVVRFNDSFADPIDLGSAQLFMSKGRLKMKVSTRPPVGYLNFDNRAMLKTKAKIASDLSLILAKCVDSEPRQEHYLSQTN